jgi:propanol-preferring alcohol dehydrogenase
MAKIDYEKELWQEKEVKSVANVTHRDIEAMLAVAGAAGLRAEVRTYPLQQANTALRELKAGASRGAAVLSVAT